MRHYTVHRRRRAHFAFAQPLDGQVQVNRHGTAAVPYRADRPHEAALRQTEVHIRQTEAGDGHRILYLCVHTLTCGR